MTIVLFLTSLACMVLAYLFLIRTGYLVGAARRDRPTSLTHLLIGAVLMNVQAGLWAMFALKSAGVFQ